MCVFAAGRRGATGASNACSDSVQAFCCASATARQRNARRWCARRQRVPRPIIDPRSGATRRPRAQLCATSAGEGCRHVWATRALCRCLSNVLLMSNSACRQLRGLGLRVQIAQRCRVRPKRKSHRCSAISRPRAPIACCRIAFTKKITSSWSAASREAAPPDAVAESCCPKGQLTNDPHALRRLRDRAWLIIGQEMRPLQHTLLRASLPGAALERRRP